MQRLLPVQLRELFIASNLITLAGAAVGESLAAGQALHAVHKAIAPAYERMERQAA